MNRREKKSENNEQTRKDREKKVKKGCFTSITIHNSDSLLSRKDSKNPTIFLCLIEAKNRISFKASAISLFDIFPIFTRFKA